MHDKSKRVYWALTVFKFMSPTLVKASNPLNICTNRPVTSTDHTATAHSRDFWPLFIYWFPTVDVKKNSKKLFNHSFLVVSAGSPPALYIWVGMWYCLTTVHIRYNCRSWQCIITHKLVKIKLYGSLYQRTKFKMQYEKCWLNMQNCEYPLVAFFDWPHGFLTTVANCITIFSW